jgi:hypothetical protein
MRCQSQCFWTGFITALFGTLFTTTSTSDRHALRQGLDDRDTQSLRSMMPTVSSDSWGIPVDGCSRPTRQPISEIALRRTCSNRAPKPVGT